jgi:hypothetical protein
MEGRKWRITLVFETEHEVSWADAGSKANDVATYAQSCADKERDNCLSFLTGSIEPARTPIAQPFLEALDDR